MCVCVCSNSALSCSIPYLPGANAHNRHLKSRKVAKIAVVTQHHHRAVYCSAVMWPQWSDFYLFDLHLAAVTFIRPISMSFQRHRNMCRIKVAICNNIYPVACYGGECVHHFHFADIFRLLVFVSECLPRWSLWILQISQIRKFSAFVNTIQFDCWNYWHRNLWALERARVCVCGHAWKMYLLPKTE